MGSIVSLVVIVAVLAVVWWLFKKVLHLGFMIALGLLLLVGWWFFFVR